jgi:hypothetical protein
MVVRRLQDAMDALQTIWQSGNRREAAAPKKNNLHRVEN